MAEEDEEQYQRLNIYVPSDVAEKAKIKAIRQKTSVSKVVTEHLRRYIEEQPEQDAINDKKDSKEA